MMASIPNMRSAPLPAATGKTGGAETAPGDFAAQLPIAQGQIVPLVTPGLRQNGEDAALVIPEVGEALAPGEGETPEALGDTLATGEMTEAQADAIVLPFLPNVPSTPGPRAQPVVSEAGTAQQPAPGVQAPAGKGAGPACESDGKTPLAPPIVPITPEATGGTTKAGQELIEAAVKELLQRKQVSAKAAATPISTGKADAAQPETAPVEAKAPARPAAAPTPIAPIVASALTTMAEQPQPALAPTATQVAATRADAATTISGPSTADLAVERQLDLARGSEWLDRLTRDIARAGSNDGPLHFRLHPQTLGHLHVELQQGDHGTAVRLTVETEAARQLLADAQPRLAAEARAQGVRITETHVDLSGSGRHAPGDQRRQDETRPSHLIRTARGADGDAVASTRSSGRAGLDRYA